MRGGGGGGGGGGSSSGGGGGGMQRGAGEARRSWRQRLRQRLETQMKLLHFEVARESVSVAHF
jgi:hypothetical protein